MGLKQTNFSKQTHACEIGEATLFCDKTVRYGNL